MSAKTPTQDEIDELYKQADLSMRGGETEPEVKPEPEVKAEEKLEEKAEPEVKPKAEAAEPAPKDDAKENSLDYWKQKANVAEGRLRVEGPKSAADIRALKEENERYNARLKEIDAQEYARRTEAIRADNLAAEQRLREAEKADEESRNAKLSLDLINDGEDVTASKVQKFIDDQVSYRMDKISKNGIEVNERLEKLTKRMADDSYNRFLVDLKSAVPDCYEIDKNDAFVGGYLSRPDGFSGRTVGDTLKSANSSGDYGRVIAIYKAFSDSIKAKPEVIAGSSNGGGDLASPASGRVAAVPAAVDSSVPGLQELMEIRDKMDRNYYQNRPSEWKIAEAKLKRAMAADYR